jgi:Uma2 family endonuclease
MEQQEIEPRLMTIDEYLEFEFHSDEKHEYYSGEIVSMAGGTPAHALIAGNIISAINKRLKGDRCRVYTSDLRVRIPNHPTYVYPDVTVVCGPLEFDPRDKRKMSIINPKLLFEVFSASSYPRDWGQKPLRYTSIPSVEEYVMVTQSEAETFSIYRTSGGTWGFAPLDGLDVTLRVQSLDIEIPLAEIYAGVEFPPAPVEPE